MSTTLQAEIAATPAPAQTTEAEPSPASAPASAETTPSTLLPDNADDILWSDAPVSVESEAAPVATPAPAEAAPEDAVIPTETPAGETPQAIATEQPIAEAPASEPEKILPNRISTKQFPPNVQKAMALFHEMKSEGMTFEGCLQIVNEENQQAKAAETQAVEEAANQPPDPVTKLEQEVAELDQKIEDGTLVGNDVKLYAQKVAQLEAAKIRAENQQTANEAQARSAITKDFAESKARAYGAYPVAQDPESPLGIMIETELAAWQSPQHPNHDTLREKNAPELIMEAAVDKTAAVMAKTLGISKDEAKARLKAGPKATPIAPATVAPSAPAAVQPAAGNMTTAPGNRSAPAPAAAPSLQDIVKQSRLDPKVADEALGYGSGGSLFG